MSADFLVPLDFLGGGWRRIGVGLVGTPASPSVSNPGPPFGLRAFPFAQTDPAEKVWVEVEPVGLLKEGDHVTIRCLTDGNPQPHFTINKKVTER